MSYKAGIVKAITELKDRTGSSSIAIKKHMQANLAADKKWMNAAFLKALKDGVEAGIFVKVKSSYKLSASAKSAGKPKKAAPKKKATPKKTAPKKKTVRSLHS
jgi:histone H1/5